MVRTRSALRGYCFISVGRDVAAALPGRAAVRERLYDPFPPRASWKCLTVRLLDKCLRVVAGKGRYVARIAPSYFANP